MSTAHSARIASRSVHNMVLATEAFVKSQLAALNHDASHDWRYFHDASHDWVSTQHWTVRCSHIDRVRKMALVLAKEEGDAVSLYAARYRNCIM